uniref:Uncharacterized protein n=1 Tax=Coccidioides posadasii RMSCC 3488 TaxID=454284 RepID=A0A0J6FFK2_COCPO|nr:hypothetical protein CPAG_08231 [Coccidioides posadasii RMSCC 3488]
MPVPRSENTNRFGSTLKNKVVIAGKKPAPETHEPQNGFPELEMGNSHYSSWDTMFNSSSDAPASAFGEALAMISSTGIDNDCGYPPKVKLPREAQCSVIRTLCELSDHAQTAIWSLFKITNLEVICKKVLVGGMMTDEPIGPEKGSVMFVLECSVTPKTADVVKMKRGVQLAGSEISLSLYIDTLDAIDNILAWLAALAMDDLTFVKTLLQQEKTIDGLNPRRVTIGLDATYTSDKRVVIFLHRHRGWDQSQNLSFNSPVRHGVTSIPFRRTLRVIHQKLSGPTPASPRESLAVGETFKGLRDWSSNSIAQPFLNHIELDASSWWREIIGFRFNLEFIAGVKPSSHS